MGFRYRKSINLGGGFRINLSKSGVGYSWGTKGFRITKTANGKTRKTYSIPGTGISYSTESGSKKTPAQRSSYHSNPTPLPNATETYGAIGIETAALDNFQSAEFHNITSTMENTLCLNKWSTILIWCVLLCFSNPVFIFLPLLGIALKILAHTKGVVHLEYDFDAEKLEESNRRLSAWEILAEGDKEWQILSAQFNSNTKTHAGANRSINRAECKIIRKSPFYIKSNVELVQLKLQKETFIILPDKIFIVRKNKVGAEEYENIRISTSSVHFVESDPVPKDAQIVDYTWRYVNKNGTPDKRYKDNRRLPICNYGVVYIRSDSGINVELQVSNIQKCSDFSMLIE